MKSFVHGRLKYETEEFELWEMKGKTEEEEHDNTKSFSNKKHIYKNYVYLQNIYF